MNENNIYNNGTYLEKNPTWHEEDSAWKAGHILRLLNRNGIIPATLCEVGCGAGGILACLAQAYGDAVKFDGYEVSPQAFAICAARSTTNLAFHLKEPREEKNQMFDVVMAIDVVEHVDDYYEFLRAMRFKATYKIFHIPLEVSVQSLLLVKPLVAGREDYGHIHHFMKDTALDALMASGYQVVDWFYTPGFLELTKTRWRGRCLKSLVRVCYRLRPDLTVRLFGGFSLMVLAK